MTFKSWFTATCAQFNLTSEQIDLIINNTIGADRQDEDVDVIEAKKALCNEFATMIPLSNVTEGGFSLSWNFDAVKLWYSATCKQLGLTNVLQPRVKAHSDIW